VHVLIISTATKNALNKTEFMTNIDLLHVSAPRCHLQKIFQIKGTQAQHVHLSMLNVCSFDLKNSLKMASRCRNTHEIFIINYMLLNAFVGYCTNYKATKCLETDF